MFIIILWTDSFDADDDLPPSPPEEWETSNDRLGGKYVVHIHTKYCP